MLISSQWSQKNMDKWYKNQVKTEHKFVKMTDFADSSRLTGLVQIYRD